MTDRLEEIEGRLQSVNGLEWCAHTDIALAQFQVAIYKPLNKIEIVVPDCGDRPVMKFIAHAPADIAYLVAEVKRTREELVQSQGDLAHEQQMRSADVREAYWEVNRMHSVYTSAMTFYAAADDDMMSEETVDLFAACRKAREDRHG